MGLMCCKSTTDEGLVYKDEDFKNFYTMDTPVIHKGESEPQKEANMTVKATSKLANSKSISDTNTISSDLLDKSKGLLNSLNTMNTASTKVNFVGLDQKLNPILKTVQTKMISELEQTNNSKEPLGGLKPCSKILKILIKESKYNNVGGELIINSQGLEGSLRQAQDGHVFFGHKSDDIDYYLNPEEGIQPKHFEIKYDLKLNEYLVNNIKGSGVFIKIDKPFELKDGLIISFGTNHIVVSITFKSEEQRYNTSIIKFKAIYGPNKGKD